MEKGLISFIMLTYRRFDGIRETLDSLFQQDYPRMELILSDDGSPEYEDSVAEIRQFVEENRPAGLVRAEFSHLPENRGTVKNANHALSLARGEYIKILGAEDVFAGPDTLSRYVSFLEESGCLICFARMEGVTEDGRIVRHLASSAEDYDVLRGLTPLQLRDRLFVRNCLPAPAWFAKTELFDRYGPFPETGRLIEDYPFWLDLCTEGVSFAFLDEVMIRYRLTGVSGAGNYGKRFMEDMFAIYDRHIFPRDRRYGVLQPLYNRVKRAGLNAYMDLACWPEYSKGRRLRAWLVHGPFFLYIRRGNRKLEKQNRKEGAPQCI